jgi:hypothetical protein
MITFESPRLTGAFLTGETSEQVDLAMALRLPRCRSITAATQQTYLNETTGDSMKTTQSVNAKKTWIQPAVKVIDLNVARGGATGSSDHTPGGHS